MRHPGWYYNTWTIVFAAQRSSSRYWCRVAAVVCLTVRSLELISLISILPGVAVRCGVRYRNRSIGGSWHLYSPTHKSQKRHNLMFHICRQSTASKNSAVLLTSALRAAGHIQLMQIATVERAETPSTGDRDTAPADIRRSNSMDTFPHKDIAVLKVTHCRTGSYCVAV